MRTDFRSKRKQDNIEADERREVAVKVMLNLDELGQIEAARTGTKLSRAEVIRAMVLGKKIERAPIVPEINIEVARNLGRALGNLSTVAVAMRAGDFIELDDIRRRTTEFQKILRGQT